MPDLPAIDDVATYTAIASGGVLGLLVLFSHEALPTTVCAIPNIGGVATLAFLGWSISLSLIFAADQTSSERDVLSRLLERVFFHFGLPLMIVAVLTGAFIAFLAGYGFQVGCLA